MKLLPLCSQCRHQLASVDTPCPECGSEARPVYECPECGHDMDAFDPRCAHCSYSLLGQTQIMEQPEAPDPLAEEKADMQYDSDRLDLMEAQGDLNRRELDLYTRDKRDQLAAKAQQEADEELVRDEIDAQIAEKKAAHRHQQKMAGMEREGEIRQQQDAAKRQRDAATVDRLSQRNEDLQKIRQERWKRKTAELKGELEYERSRIEAKQELSAAQRQMEIDRLEEQHKLRLRAAKSRLEAELDAQRQRYEAKLARQDAGFQQGLSQDEQQFAQELSQDDRSARQAISHQSAEQDLEHRGKREEAALQQEQDRHEMELTLEMKARADELNRQQQQADHQRMMEQEEAVHRREQEKVAQLDELSPDAQLAAMSPEQAKIVAGLRETEALKDWTPEQILARAAEGSPDVARAFLEKFKSEGGEQKHQEITALYERMLQQQAESGAAQAAAMKDVLMMALQTQRDTAVAAAGPDAPPAPAAAESTGALKVCPTCGATVPIAAAVCPQCSRNLV